MSNENKKRKNDDLKNEKAPKKPNWIKWGVIINSIMLIAVMMTIFNITIPLPSFAKVEHTVYTLEEPISSEILPALKASPLYYAELIVNPPQKAGYGDDLKFSAKVIEKGKKYIEEPEFRIFIVDSIGAIRGVYPLQIVNLLKTNSTNLLVINDDIGREETTKDVNFKFRMPPEDQKVIGDWKFFIYLFDKNSGESVSYAVYEFEVGKQEQSNIAILMFWAMMMTMMMMVFFSIYRKTILQHRLIMKIEKKEKKEKEVEEKKK